MPKISFIPSLAQVDAAAWNALVGPDDVFTEHAFLLALEQSGCVGPESGWLPHYLLCHEAEQLLAAMPLYLKSDSYGEFIFDWAWAQGAQRLGIDYFPKLTAAIPFTPSPGARLLLHPTANAETLVPEIEKALLALAQELKCSSIHLLFMSEKEQQAFCAVKQFMPRLTHQFHWHNNSYKTFDDFTNALRSHDRKQVRKERKGAQGLGLNLVLKRGTELTEFEWESLYRCYRYNLDKHMSEAYLTQDFFKLLPQSLADRVLVTLAYAGNEIVAATLNFQKGKKLYGRYWGCLKEYNYLHFEMCYYMLIEHAIAQGYTQVEAGAQGIHKFHRGYLPVPIYSAHWIEHPILREAIAHYVQQETEHTKLEMEHLMRHMPYKRPNSAD